jgi:hypothetical protein
MVDVHSVKNCHSTVRTVGTLSVGYGVPCEPVPWVRLQQCAIAGVIGNSTKNVIYIFDPKHPADTTQISSTIQEEVQNLWGSANSNWATQVRAKLPLLNRHLQVLAGRPA